MGARAEIPTYLGGEMKCGPQISGSAFRSAAMLLLLSLFWCSASSSGQSARIVNLEVLRDVICEQIETTARPMADGTPPNLAYGDGGRALGKCQINVIAALDHGGLSPQEGFPALGNEGRARQVALEIFTWCAHPHWQGTKRHRRWVPGRTTPRGLAACYNGPGLDYPRLHDTRPTYVRLRAYAEKVAIAYDRRMVASR